MSTSPVGPEDIRAAAEVHRELGPEYSDAVVAAFLDKVDREVAARVEARLAETRRGRRGRLGQRVSRRTLVAGVVMGACAGALISGITVASLDHSDPARPSGPLPTVHVRIFRAGSGQTILLPDGRKISLPPGGLAPPPGSQGASSASK